MARLRKLTAAQRERIRLRITAGDSRTKIARDYGVTLSTIAYHLDGKGTRHIGLPWTKALSAAHAAINRRDLTAASAAYAEVSRILAVEAGMTAPSNKPGDDAITA